MLQESNNRELIVSVLFQLDIKAVELHKNGVKLKLEEQPFKVCVCSCGNPAKWFHVRKFAFPTAPDTLAFLFFRLQRHGPQEQWFAGNPSTRTCGLAREIFAAT